MTSNAGAGSRILGSLRSADGKGAVRMQDRFDTDIDDLWSALTDPSRLARWLGEVEGVAEPGRGACRGTFWVKHDPGGCGYASDVAGEPGEPDRPGAGAAKCR